MEMPINGAIVMRRFGNKGDGGYVVYVADELAQNPSEPEERCPWDVYITAGVGAEESFTWDFLNKWGQRLKGRCWAFDGTIAAYPKCYIPKGCHIWFVAKNIGANMTQTTVNLHQLLEQHANVFLKMDIEGAEYEWLLTLDEERHLAHIRQIVIEFHNINTSPTAELFSSVWEKIQRTHRVAHIHGNNYGGVSQQGRPNVIEVTFIRDNDCDNNIPIILESDIKIFPVAGLDYPNDPTKPDLIHGIKPIKDKEKL